MLYRTLPLLSTRTTSFTALCSYVTPTDAIRRRPVNKYPWVTLNAPEERDYSRASPSPHHTLLERMAARFHRPTFPSLVYSFLSRQILSLTNLTSTKSTSARQLTRELISFQNFTTFALLKIKISNKTLCTFRGESETYRPFLFLKLCTV